MRHTKKMLRSKIVHLKKIYKFCFDHFFVLIEKTLLKIKKCSFWPKNVSYEKMLISKIVYLEKIYKFDFDYFLIKCTKNVIKNLNLVLALGSRDEIKDHIQIHFCYTSFIQ